MGAGVETASAKRRRSVLLVHGRDFKPGAATLLELTLDALQSGFRRDLPEHERIVEDIDVDLAWYGDLSAELLSRQGRRYDERLDVGDRKNALAALKQIPARKRFGIRHYDSLPGKSALGEFVADTALPVLGRVGLWHWVCRRHAPDFAEYLVGESDYAAAVRERVRNRLASLLARGDSVALVTHGTGAVVAWDVLWELSAENAEAKVDLWVTLGSPLGDAQVQKHLLGAGETSVARFPANVISWCNVAAEDDYTCHDKTLADDYRRMMNERLISAISDYRIYNHAVRFGRSNPHSSVGYYIHPRLTKILADWLGLTARISP